MTCKCRGLWKIWKTQTYSNVRFETGFRFISCKQDRARIAGGPYHNHVASIKITQLSHKYILQIS